VGEAKSQNEVKKKKRAKGGTRERRAPQEHAKEKKERYGGSLGVRAGGENDIEH